MQQMTHTGLGSGAAMVTYARPVAAGLERLASIAQEPTDADADILTGAVLTLIAETLDAGVTHLSRVDGETQHVERVYDRAGMDLRAGALVPLCESYCQYALTSARGLSIADAHADARVATLPSTRDIGIGAYTGVALYRPDGTLYGTLCALWPRPRAVLAGETALLALAGRVIMGARARESLLVERAAAAAREDAWRAAHDRLQEVLIVTGHELRTPLTTVTAAVQLARQRLAGSAADRWLEQAANGARRLARIVDDALELAHAEAGAPVTPQEAGACDVGALVAEVVADLRLAWPRRTIALDRPAEEGPLPVRADPDRLARAITNLLGNALKYSSPECPVTVVACRDGAEARVEVRDEGPGIPPDEHGRLWERFHRVAGTVVRDGSSVGLGLGLYLVRSIVEAHGGRVGLESVPGRGSTFWFTAPLTADLLDDDAV